MKFLNIFIFLVFIGCSSMEETLYDASNLKYLEAGKCYYSLSVFSGSEKNTCFESNGFVLELVDPKFVEKNIKYTKEELELLKKDSNYYQIPVKESHTKFIFREPYLEKVENNENGKGYLFCKVEIPEEKIIISIEEMEKRKNTISLKKVNTHPKIIKKYKKKKPKKIKPNQCYQESGCYQTLKEYSSIRSKSRFGVRDLQKKLNDLGYELTENNIMNENTKKALIDFQKKNNLNTGNLDSETLKALGFEYE